MRRFFGTLSSFFLSVGLGVAFNNGADPGHSGVPGEQTCAQSGCHTGTVNPAGGNVVVEFPSGLNYTPGTRQRLTVRINDPAARNFGFQLTVRLASNSRTNAGTLTNDNAGTFVWCSTADFTRQQEKPTAGCPANQPIESIQQGAPINAPNNSWVVLWDPPATAQGEVVVYVSGNGANGNGQNSGDRIYTNSYRLQPATGGGGGGGNRPTISAGGVITAGAFGAATTIAPGSWIEIYGANLATETRQWGGADFTGNNAPTVLGGVRVSIGGTPAFVQLISPGQINAQVPGGLSAGATTMTVTNANGTSDNFNITVAARSPGLLSPPAFRVNNRQYLAALYPDNTTFVGPANFISGVASRPARAGDVIVTYGVGFGATNPNVPPGQIVTQTNSLPNFTFRFGNTNGEIVYAGLAPNFVGLYQFNIRIPTGLAAGDVPVTVSVDGVNVSQTLFTTVQ